MAPSPSGRYVSHPVITGQLELSSKGPEIQVQYTARRLLDKFTILRIEFLDLVSTMSNKSYTSSAFSASPLFPQSHPSNTRGSGRGGRGGGRGTNQQQRGGRTSGRGGRGSYYHHQGTTFKPNVSIWKNLILYAIADNAILDKDRKQEPSSTQYPTYPKEVLPTAEVPLLLVGLLNVGGKSQLATDFNEGKFTSEVTIVCEEQQTTVTKLGVATYRLYSKEQAAGPQVVDHYKNTVFAVLSIDSPKRTTNVPLQLLSAKLQRGIPVAEVPPTFKLGGKGGEHLTHVGTIIASDTVNTVLGQAVIQSVLVNRAETAKLAESTLVVPTHTVKGFHTYALVGDYDVKVMNTVSSTLLNTLDAHFPAKFEIGAYPSAASYVPNDVKAGYYSNGLSALGLGYFSTKTSPADIEFTSFIDSKVCLRSEMETWLIDIHGHVTSKLMFLYGLGEITTNPSDGVLLTVNNINFKTAQQAAELSITFPRGYKSKGCLHFTLEEEGWQQFRYKVGPADNQIPQMSLAFVRPEGKEFPANHPLTQCKPSSTIIGAPFTDFNVASECQRVTAYSFTRDPSTLPTKEKAREIRGTHLHSLTAVLSQSVRQGGQLPDAPPYYEEPVVQITEQFAEHNEFEEAELAEIILLNQQTNSAAWSMPDTPVEVFNTPQEEIRNLRNRNLLLQQDAASLEMKYKVRGTALEQLKTSHAMQLQSLTQQAQEATDKVVLLEARVVSLQTEIDALKENEVTLNECLISAKAAYDSVQAANQQMRSKVPRTPQAGNIEEDGEMHYTLMRVVKDWPTPIKGIRDASANLALAWKGTILPPQPIPITPENSTAYAKATKGLVDLINTRPNLSPAAIDSVEKFATAWAIYLKSQGLLITPYTEQITKRSRTGTNYLYCRYLPLTEMCRPGGECVWGRGTPIHANGGLLGHSRQSGGLFRHSGQPDQMNTARHLASDVKEGTSYVRKKEGIQQHDPQG